MIPSAPIVTRRLIRVLCALMLFAQQAALTHVAAHLPVAHPAQEQQVAQEDRDTRPGSELARLCDFDAAFGQLLSGGPATHHAVFSDSAVSHAALHRSRAHTAADALTPRSRGPPVLL